MLGDLFSDSRFHGYQGPSRNVRFPRATASGGGTVAKSDDGVRCVVAGRESLRVLRLSDPDDATATLDQKSAVGHGGHRVELSKNLWDGSGLKIESASTDVAWCSGHYNNKILTSARNGDLIMWDLGKPGSTKYERKTKNHIRSIHKLSCSSMVPYYCITGSADGDMRIWDLRDMSRSVMKIHHPTSVRSLVFSRSLSHPLQAVVGLDNGSIYRWDLQMGQRGQLDRLPVAHTGPILALDWCSTSVTSKGADNIATQMERSWIVSGGLDHTVKIWDLPGSSTSSHIVNKPTYVLHPSCPVRRVLWRPDYPCELALVSNAEFSGGAELLASPRMQNASPSFLSSTAPVLESKDAEAKSGLVGETVEIWDVRRGWIAKWTVDTSVSDGGVTDAAFRDSHALLVQHASGTFAQVDLRHSHRPIDAVPRVALSWNAVDGVDGALAFVADKRGKWEVPYDDVHPDRRSFVVDRRSRIKTLGDKRRVPGLQNMGMYVHVPPSADAGPDVFVRLAKGYVVPDKSRKKKEVCALNAEVAMQAGNVHAAQAWILLGSLLTDVVPESVIASLPASGGLDLPHPLIHSASAPGALPSTEGVNVHSTGSKPASYRAMSADSAIQLAGSPHSPSHSRVSHHHAQTTRSTSVNGANPASNEDRKHARHRPDQPPPPTKPPPNSRNLTPASSASSSPRHIPLSLPPTPVLPPTTTMTPATVSRRRPSILLSTPSPSPVHAHTHARRPSVYSRSMASAQSLSPSDRSLRHVGEGALDDSDSSDGGVASESVAESHVGEVDHGNGSVEMGTTPGPAPLTLPLPAKSGMSRAKARSMSAGRTGPAHPSPLSQLAGQRQWVEDDDSEREALSMDTGPGMVLSPSHAKRRIDEDEATPSPLSSDTDDERSDDSEAEIRQRAVMMKSRRKNSMAHVRRLKNRSRSSTVASLAAPGPLLSPARSSPSRLPTGSPEPTQDVIGRTGSQSSVQTVIATSIREQENEVGGSGKDVAEDEERVGWVEMSYEQQVAVVEEERQLREAGWRALREALEEYADEGDIQMCAMLALVAREELKLEPCRTIQFVEAYVDMLARYRLHPCVAYLRKYSRVDEVQKTTRSVNTARDSDIYGVSKVSKARGCCPFAKPVCKGDACGVCDVQGGGSEMFDMSSSCSNIAISMFSVFAWRSSGVL
ncbi:hypothetical protein JVT61DRAFT_2787 [Boletus reticuloceps]|uniref:WD40 repeat-like protein n=1 Tax=Boletus reticuloceps TaxID=495285 RepID=A0A8I2YNJ5_9AGAM|nr:hypothetical protein JVT61DRAFT_2787 [Boletus reticuloceps]